MQVKQMGFTCIFFVIIFIADFKNDIQCLL